MDENIQKRERTIVRASMAGILANLLLSIFKAVMGISTNSIAILLDAVNNISDALSSIVTIIGIKLAGKAPDKEHPFGHGRIEYITTVVISGFVLYAGITALIESVKQIIHPEIPNYSNAALIIMLVSMIVKAILSIFFTRISKKVNSKTLYATGIDALYDAILSSAVLSCVIISMKQGRYYEAWVSAFISLFIIKSGIEMMKEGLDEILGKRASTSLVNAIKDAVCKDMQVKGAYDLFLYNYGPDRYYGSVHVEVFETLSARDIDSLTRRIQEKIYKDYGVILTAIGIYAVSGDASIESDIRRKVYDTVMAHPEAKQVHGFYLDGESKKFIFDVVLSFGCNAQKVVDEIKAELNSMYPDFEQDMTVDLDVS